MAHLQGLELSSIFFINELEFCRPIPISLVLFICFFLLFRDNLRLIFAFEDPNELSKENCIENKVECKELNTRAFELI